MFIEHCVQQPGSVLPCLCLPFQLLVGRCTCLFHLAATPVWGLLHLHPEGKISFGSSPHRSVLHGHLHSLADGVCSWHPLFRSEDQTPPLSCAITDFPPSPFQYVRGEFALLRKTLSLICVQPADCSNAGAAILEIGSRLCLPAVPNCITERQCIYGRVSLQAPWGCQISLLWKLALRPAGTHTTCTMTSPAAALAQVANPPCLFLLCSLRWPADDASLSRQETEE